MKKELEQKLKEFQDLKNDLETRIGLSTDEKLLDIYDNYKKMIEEITVLNKEKDKEVVSKNNEIYKKIGAFILLILISTFLACIGSALFFTKLDNWIMDYRRFICYIFYFLPYRSFYNTLGIFVWLIY